MSEPIPEPEDDPAVHLPGLRHAHELGKQAFADARKARLEGRERSER